MNKFIKKYGDLIFFAILAAILSILFGKLVFSQTIYAGKEGGYPSDIYAYMLEMQGLNSGYPFPYPLFFKTGKFLSLFMPVEYAITILEVTLNLVSLIAAKYYCEKEISLNTTNNSLLSHYVISFVTIATFLLSMWWLPRFGRFVLPHKYQVYDGTLTGNPWHNATYIATRPFAILSFFIFLKILKEYNDEINKKDFILFTIFLLLTTLTKPSFTFVMVSAAGLWMLFSLFIKKFKNLKNTLILGCCFIPTFITLFFQFANVFGEKSMYEEHGLGFCFFDVWKLHNPHIPEAIFYANAFSLVCLLIFIKDLKTDAKYRFTILLFVISILEAGILCEKGLRYGDFNFSWGYMHGIFFFELYSVIKLLAATINRTKKKWILAIGWLFFTIQLVMGIFYFYGIYCGRDYNTLLPVTWL